MREVVLDIETVPCSKERWKHLVSRVPALGKRSWKDTALDWTFGQIICVGLLVIEKDQENELCIAGPEETELLRAFWEALQPEDIIIGHNVLAFDLPYLQARSVICQVKPSRDFDLRRYYTTTVYDTMQIWSNWNMPRYPKLDTLAAVLDLEGKSGSGDQVSKWFEANDWERIKQYCMQDVRLTRAVYRRFREYGL